MSHLFVAATVILGVCPVAFAADPILCQGEASGHLQGFDSDGKFIYWSTFTSLIKKDNGRWTASAAPAILRNGRLEWSDE